MSALHLDQPEFPRSSGIAPPPAAHPRSMAEASSRRAIQLFERRYALNNLSLIGESAEIEKITRSSFVTESPAEPVNVQKLGGLPLFPKQREEHNLETIYNEVAEVLSQHYVKSDIDRVRAAFDFMCKCHDGQKRKSGEPYAIHPAATALIVARMGLDVDSVIAAFLHDVAEDTRFTISDIGRLFGQNVSKLVNGLTKISNIRFRSVEQKQSENLRKLFLAICQDPRALIIKIADRLHNMRTLEFHTPEKQREISRETLEIYAPLAYRIGLQAIKGELEDISLQYLDPIAYHDITEELGRKERENPGFLDRIKDTLVEKLTAEGVSAVIDSRIKHKYSIFRKMYSQHKPFSSIFDTFAIRIIVRDERDCYVVLGMVHSLFSPVDGRYKDYISHPKLNFYRSIHTTVREAIPFEIQIRTEEMHRVAENGLAAHWQYKSGLRSDLDLAKKMAWVRELLENQQNTDAESFVSNLRFDLYRDEVLVMTPGEEVKSLSRGSNCIDFAYAIHSEVGNHMKHAKVNGAIVPFSYTLQNGDVVEIQTDKKHTPVRDWLQIVKTTEARNKIKQWLKLNCHEENVRLGKDAFDKEFKYAGLSREKCFDPEILETVLHLLGYAELEKMYASIGFGGTTAVRIVNRFRDEILRREDEQIEPEPLPLVQALEPVIRSAAGILIDGQTGCEVKYARCCMPVHGDAIIGFITKGHGISIHRIDCDSVEELRLKNGKDRFVRAKWDTENSTVYQTNYTVRGRSCPKLFKSVTDSLWEAKVYYYNLSSKEVDTGTTVIRFTVDVKNAADSDALCERLNGIEEVLSAERSGGGNHVKPPTSGG